MTKLHNIRDLSKLLKDHQKNGKRVVFTVGAYDLLHCDHASYLLEAKTKGDILVVGIESNISRKEEKGLGHPLIDEKTRAEMLSFFSFVDYLVIVHRKKLLSVFKSLKPNIFYTTYENWHSIIWHGEAGFLEQNKIKVIKVPRKAPYVATSTLVNNIADLKIKEIMEHFFGKIKIDLSTGDFSGRGGTRQKSSIKDNIIKFPYREPVNLMGIPFIGLQVEFSNLEKLHNRLKKEGKTVVFTAGSYDLLHVGHARFLQKAKSLGDILVVGIPSNEQVAKAKGRGRPIVDELSRALLLRHLGCVDFVVIFNNPTVLQCLQNLKPDIFYTVKEEWNSGFKESLEYKEVKSYNGKVARVPRQSPFLSASSIIDKSAGIRIQQIFEEFLKLARAKSALAEKKWQDNSDNSDVEWN